MSGPTVKIKKKPSEIPELMKMIKKIAKGPEGVKVGFPSNIPYPNEESTNLIVVAATNEFGSADGRVPERSFLRAGLNEKKAELRKVWKQRLAKQILEGKITPEKALRKIGLWAQTVVQNKIRSLKTPPNNDRTIARKKSSNPLIDTGHMIQSVRFEVDNDGLD